MTDAVGRLCLIAVFCGLAMSIMPEGGVKRAGGLLCTVILLLTVVTGIKEFDFKSYSQELAEYREYGKSLSADTVQVTERLNRMVIEEECASYIKDKASELGVDAEYVSVQAEWSMDSGVWVPETVKIGSARNYQLEGVIVAELGISSDNIEWNSHEKNN